jgi:hypothetical protein
MPTADSKLVVAQNSCEKLGVAQVEENAALLESDFGGGKEASCTGTGTEEQMTGMR